MGCSCIKNNKKKEITPIQENSDATYYEKSVAINKAVAEEQDKIKPTEQCIACCQKHLDEAWTLFTEFGYSNENRRLVRGNLRAIVLHTYKEWPQIAQLARECALLVQEAKDKEADDLFQKLCCLVDEEFNNANPEVNQRLLELQKGTMADVIIPLGIGSQHNNDELRFLLRSIEKNLKGINRVFLATTACPDWVNQDKVIVVPIADIYDSNKDANLHLKTLKTIEKYDVGDFVWCSDDNVFLREMDVNEIPVLHNHRNNSMFYANSLTKWQNRVRNTLEFAKSRGVNLQHNYECHAPQLFNGQKLLEGMKGVDYANQPGLTIYTAWRVVTNTWQGSKDQRNFKHTFELPMDDISLPDNELMAKPFLGYNDQCVEKVLERLRKLFPQRSKYEL